MTLSIEELKKMREAYAKRSTKVVAALDELIAIREQQGNAVSMDALRDAVAEMSGGLPTPWNEGCDKGHHAVPFINFNSLHRIVTKFTAPQKPVVLPGINEDLIDILGRPNFTCSGLAEIFRRNGADIKRKSENEQAFVIHWLLGIYLNHGSDWRTTAESEIKELAAKANAGGIVKEGE